MSTEYIIDVELGNGERRMIRDDDAVHEDTFASMFSRADVKEVLLNLYHPVGSYFETTDTSFLPGEVWGGTWVLESAGLVHVSGGSGYPVDNTNAKTGGNTTSSVTPAGTVGSTTLTAAQSGNQTLTANTSTTGAHTHSVTGTANSAGAHSHSMKSRWSNGKGSLTKYMTTENRATMELWTDSAGTHTHSLTATAGSNGNHAHSVTIAAKNAAAGHTHSFTGTAASFSIMQSYKAVYRWYRTA